MSSSYIFANIFKRFASDCYVVEFDLNTECTNKSEDCTICAGTGHVIKKVYKYKVIADSNSNVRSLLSETKAIDTGKYYKDARLAYFLKDCKFNLSPNTERVVLTIVNGSIDSVYTSQYLEPVLENNQTVYYMATLNKSNINSSKQIDVYNQIISERRL